jgi:hypothetical protein
MRESVGGGSSSRASANNLGTREVSPGVSSPELRINNVGEAMKHSEEKGRINVAEDKPSIVRFSDAVSSTKSIDDGDGCDCAGVGPLGTKATRGRTLSDWYGRTLSQTPEVERSPDMSPMSPGNCSANGEIQVFALDDSDEDIKEQEGGDKYNGTRRVSRVKTTLAPTVMKINSEPNDDEDNVNVSETSREAPTTRRRESLKTLRWDASTLAQAEDDVVKPSSWLYDDSQQQLPVNQGSWIYDDSQGIDQAVAALGRAAALSSFYDDEDRHRAPTATWPMDGLPERQRMDTVSRTTSLAASESGDRDNNHLRTDTEMFEAGAHAKSLRTYTEMGLQSFMME